MKHTNQLTYNQITFSYTDDPNIAEREIHLYHELLFYLDGDAVFLSENSQQILQSASLLVIPKETYHFFKLQKSKRFLRLKIAIPHATAESLPLQTLFSQLRIFSPLSKPLQGILNRLCQALQETGDEMAGFHAYAALLMLLSELILSDSGGIGPNAIGSGFIPEVVAYVNDHLSDTLSAAALSAQLNVSASSITHTFKKELGISLHQYITQKRMMHAQRLLAEQKLPTKIFIDCGYRDYSSFYKAYINFFGHPPSQNNI